MTIQDMQWHGYSIGLRKQTISKKEKDELKIALGLIILVSAVTAMPIMPDLSIYLILAGLALRSPLWAVRALLAGLLASSITPALTQDFIPVEVREFATSSGAGLSDFIGRYLILFAAAASVFLRPVRHHFPAPYVLPFFIFIAYLVIHAASVSYYPLISLLKTFSLCLGISILFRATLQADRQSLLTFYAVFTGCLLMASVPLAFIPQGYMLNGTGFQGVLAHPQMFGVIAGVFGAFLFVNILNTERPSKYIILLMILSLLSVFLSEARTGMLAFLIGATCGTVHSLMKRPHLLGRVLVITLLLIITGSLLLLVDETRLSLLSFISKGDLTASNWADIFSKSRGHLTDASLQTFYEYPWFGVGFGLPHPDTVLSVIRDPVFGLPVGASVEKGLIFTATLEEIGVVGAILMSLFIISIITYLFHERQSEGVALAIAALASNIGEATLYSFGGLGLFIWISITIGLAREHAP
jgi:hypothetical protein